MEIILLERVAHLGELGDKVRVKPGFGRNFLIPTGRALPATKANLVSFEARRAEIEAAAGERSEKAKERALALEGLNITIAANAGEEGRLFGSVGAHEIAAAVKKMGHTLSKGEVHLAAGPIRQIGDYEVELNLLGEEITAKVRVSVTAL
ncbi:MAG TPA: 50S ribosomal protein L9 [Gammaproteobacteria bacterium]|nr:50S ribosomal protein L9 [Gammaproteobacteria bacterium]